MVAFRLHRTKHAFRRILRDVAIATAISGPNFPMRLLFVENTPKSYRITMVRGAMER
jgi:hypothetical protein